MKLKIYDKLKKKQHREIAFLQDIVVDITYQIFPKAVLHGGTAIWRCYNGSRFSEDLDFYLTKEDLKKADLFKKTLIQKKLEIKKFKITENLIYAKISFNNIEMRFEASFFNKPIKNIIIKGYEAIDGNYINIFTLSPKELIKEKIETYLSRRFIRDLYDIYILLNYIKENKKIKPLIRKMIESYKKPVDETILSSLIFIGAIPTTKQILDSIRRWAK